MATGSGTGTPASGSSTWTYTTKAKVADFAKVAQSILKDEWIQWVEDLIDEWCGTTWAGTASYTELISGDGTTALFVEHPPIVSITSLTIDDTTCTASDYKIFDNYIELIDYNQTQISEALYSPSIFPIGVGNVSITYVGGSATVPARVELAATQMVAAIALVSQRQGADASLKYSRVTETRGDNSTVTENFGLQSSLTNIMKHYLPRKLKAA